MFDLIILGTVIGSILLLILIINLICCIFRIANATEETRDLLKKLINETKKDEV